MSRNATRSASSPGRPYRPSGIARSDAARISSGVEVGALRPSRIQLGDARGVDPTRGDAVDPDLRRSSSDSVLTSPARPGRSTFDVVSPGIGLRTEDDRITAIAGSVPARSGWSASRITRIVLRSVPSIAAVHASSSRASNSPGGGPPLLTSSRSRPPRASTAPETARAAPSAVARSAGTGAASSSRAASPSLGVSRALSASAAPSSARAAATARPRPPLPPQTSALRPVSPRGS